jgi:hypothetical protein
MKLPKDTGRRENLIGMALWILFIILYYCAISLLLRGSVIPDMFGQAYGILDDLVTLCIIVVSVIAGLLTARTLFRVFLSLKAYHAHEGAGWKEWRSRKENHADRQEGDA